MTDRLHCPACGEQEFSWINKQVQYGGILGEDGRYPGKPVVDTSGHMLGVDPDTKYECLACHLMWTTDQLVERDEQETHLNLSSFVQERLDEFIEQRE